MSLVIAKFGGSSLAEAKQFEKVKEIVLGNKDCRYVVASAPGKRFDDDVKVTDMLYACYEKASEGEDFSEIFSAIKERFQDIIKGLNLDLDLSREFAKIEVSLQNDSGRDYAASRGEYLNSIILAKYLGFYFMDAAKCIRFDENGGFNNEFTLKKTEEHLSHYERAVIPGFYGKMPNGTIKTFSRGGSDVSGALIAQAMNADVYENWTDVNGFLVTDPRIVPHARRIKSISYRELRELSYMGASVLHEDAVFPVNQAGIPINIKNTNDPKDPGTMIVKNVESDENTTHITGIAGKKGFAIILIEKSMMNSEIGFGRKVLEVLEKKKISFEHLPSGIDTMSIVLDKKFVENREEEIINSIKEHANADCVTIEYSLALIAVVGHGMRNTPGTASKVISAISNEGINIRMLDQGSSELNIIVGVDEDEFAHAVKAIYSKFE